MKHNLIVGPLMIAFGLYVSSCNTVKPLLSEIPQEDSSSRIYFYDDGWKTRKISDSTDAELYSGGIDFTLLPVGKSAPFESSISPFGKFLATRHNRVRLAEVKLSMREIDFGIYDLQKKEFVLDLSTTVPFPEFEADTYQIDWSVLDDGFYYVKSDTVKKCFPDGTEHLLVYEPGVRGFSVSPSEQRLLLVRDDSVKLYNVKDRDMQVITTGISSQKHVRGLSWSPDESQVAFANGWQLYVYTLSKRSLSEKTAGGQVLWTQWLPDGTLVYTEGTFPSYMQWLKTTESFRICKLSLGSEEDIVLHERINHSPHSVRPRLSPSGKLLMFSEKRLNGRYEIKLMSLDGQKMNTLCEGVDPSWGK